mgnify:CR=1 FL=1
MAETRYALPYISHLRVTKRPTRNWVPAGYQNKEGQDLYKQVTDLPGIECEITPYMGTVKGPATQYRFPSKAFFEAALAEVVAGPQNEQTKEVQANLEATIARKDIVWAEEVLMAGGLPVLDDLWATVFSDALDEFPSWNEKSNGDKGIPLEVKEMQWDARIPADGPKSITLKIGLFSPTSPEPALSTLQYEDAETTKQRTAMNSQMVNRIAQIEANVASLPEGPSDKRTPFGDNKNNPYWQLGARYSVVPNFFQIDATTGRQFNGGVETRWISFGLRITPEKLF